MTLINLSLLGGLLLAGIPVVLHMIMRAKPRRIEFPALNLLRTKQSSNSRRMRVRHLLLLILRVVVIAVAVLALTRPSLPAARYGLLWYEWLLLAGVVVGALLAYRWFARRADSETTAEHLRRERRGRLRVWSVLGGLVAALICVGLPWGVRLRAELMAPRSSVAPNVPVAAVFVFDTSLSMSYKQEGQTRLEHARGVALDHLKILPAGSRVAISATDINSDPLFQRDLAGAQSRIEDLSTTAVPRKLNVVIRDAIRAQVSDREDVQAQLGTTDAFAREIYLLTDLSEAAWQPADEAGLRDLLVQHDWLQIYLIDVSVSEPVNISLSQLRLSREATSGHEPITVEATVTPTPAAADSATVEIFTITQDGEEVSGSGGIDSARKSVTFAGSPPVVTFNVEGDARRGIQNGFLRLGTSDPMPFDDVRYFTFGVTPVPNVLLVGDDPLDTKYFRNAVQPFFLEKVGRIAFQCRTIPGRDFDREVLTDYDIVCVLNWRRPAASAWASLERYVREGGAVFVSTGGRGRLLDTGAWNSREAQAVLPGIPLVAPTFKPDAARINLQAEDHPIVASFLNEPDAKVELSRAPFLRSWTFDWADDHRVLMEFNDKSQRPALVERQLGRGRVLLFTSALDHDAQDSWNVDFVVADAPWAFLMFARESMQYLMGQSDAQHNFAVGQPIDIAVPSSQRFLTYRVDRPRLRRTEGAVDTGETSVLLDDIDEAGHYRLRSADETSAFLFEFTANDQDQESNLTPVTDERLAEIFGEDRITRVINPQELDRAVSLGRVGVEVFPVLMGLLILLFCAEHVMANFFYDEEPELRQPQG